MTTATTQQPKPGTVYRFIRVPELNQTTNTVVLIKNEQNDDTSTLLKVQNQSPPQMKPNTDNINNVTSPVTTGKKVKTRRDDYRRFQHNQIERARREKINNWIMKLGKIIDDNSDDDNNINNNHSTNKNGEALSKGGILEKACEYISHLKSIIKTQTQMASKDEELTCEVKRLMDENEILKIENAMLKRKCHIEDLDEDCLIKRSKSESDDFKLDIEFGDSLPCDDISS